MSAQGREGERVGGRASGWAVRHDRACRESGRLHPHRLSACALCALYLPCRRRYLADEARSLKAYGELPENSACLRECLRAVGLVAAFIAAWVASLCLCLWGGCINGTWRAGSHNTGLRCATMAARG